MANFKFKFTNPALTKFFAASPKAVAWDTEARSLAAYATKAGAISLYVHLRVGSTQRKRTIGRLGELDLTLGAEDGSRVVCRRAKWRGCHQGAEAGSNRATHVRVRLCGVHGVVGAERRVGGDHQAVREEPPAVPWAVREAGFDRADAK